MRKIFFGWFLMVLLFIGSFLFTNKVSAEDIVAPKFTPNVNREGDLKAAQEADQLNRCKGAAASSDCASKYSCDDLTTDSAGARKCNYDRCMATRDWEYCDCKYGPGGNGDSGIPLNTNFPFIGRCLKTNNGWDAALGAFPTVVQALSKMLIVIILIAWVIMIIMWGIQIAMWKPKEWKALIMKVVIWMLLLAAMWAILNFINPNFFR